MQRIAIALIFILALTFQTLAADSPLRDGDRLAICGDSITEQKMYSVFIEDYLIMCQPKAKLSATQFGWGGETSWGFLSRLDNDVLRDKFDVATTFYGMNDGAYAPMTPEKAQKYRLAQSGIVDAFKKAGVHTIVLGSPGCVDSFTAFGKDAAKAKMYNTTLAELRDIDREIAKEKDVIFADVHSAMLDTMAKAKAKLGDAYDVAGGDGVHPNNNGHLIIAYAFLRALGCDGDIGTITVDLASGKSEASAGHKIVSQDRSKVEIESSRYPFCLTTAPAGAEQTAQIVEFFPFNEDLNRFKLIVKGVKGSRAKVTWGETSKEFTATDLAKGINLAGEFVNNPFSEPFANVEKKIREEQNLQTALMREVLHPLPRLAQLLPDQQPALDQIAKSAGEKYKSLAGESSAAVKPVRHVIVIESVE